jgi:hypothetical protein
MPNDLTNSPVDRQNILNNPYAVAEIEKAVGIRGIPFEGRSVVLKAQVAGFFGVDERTIDNYLARHEDELRQNGYEVIVGKRLKEFKLALDAWDVDEIAFVDIRKAPQLGVFDIRAFLNLSMLLVESDRARQLRQAILDIVIDTINQRTGGGTRYINQRDEDFLQSAFAEEDYRKQFTDALRDQVAMGNFKYAVFTDKIYVSIFREKAQEYRKILKLEKRDKVRDTMYAEILDLVASFETGIADEIVKRAQERGRKLTALEVDQIFARFVDQPHWRPLLDKARMKMASRDLAFRDALHLQLKEYVAPIQREDYERFLGERSKDLAERLEEAKEVMKRLKDRG